MSNTLLVATTNEGKLVEVRFILGKSGIHLVSLIDIFGDEVPTVEETGNTFSENAVQKAQYFANKTHLPTLAEDSGLDVSALNGEPGIYSARWQPGSDLDRCQSLLKRMDGISDRIASFICAVCVFNPSTQVNKTFSGTVEGTIAQTVTGNNGFGYDPIFVPTGYTQSFATLDESIKNGISHRHNALQLVQTFLKNHPQFLDL